MSTTAFTTRPHLAAAVEPARVSRLARLVVTALPRLALVVLSTVAIVLVALLQGFVFLAMAGQNALGGRHGR